MALPERVSDVRLLDRFIRSLSGRLRDHALAIHGTFDEVVSRVSMMASTKWNGIGESRFRAELVRAIEDGECRKGGTQAKSTESPTVQLPATADERFASATCYYCGLKGHLARSCEKSAARGRRKI